MLIYEYDDGDDHINFKFIDVRVRVYVICRYIILYSYIHIQVPEGYLIGIIN